MKVLCCLLLVALCLLASRLQAGVAPGHQAATRPSQAECLHQPQQAVGAPGRAQPPTPTEEDPAARRKPRAWKKKGVALALCLFAGFVAAHRYYLGARKPLLTAGYLVLAIPLWPVDLGTLLLDGMDRYYFNDRLFAAFDH
ncbi:MAG: TM2 domain-containing protein [Bacteroidetes bacterium]|nr:TM2 domain-containing protein [Bacteroidota bacterium]